MKLKYLIPLFATVSLLMTGQTHAEDAFYKIAVKDLKLTSGELPKRAANPYPNYNWRMAAETPAYAVLDGDGEAFLGSSRGDPVSVPAFDYSANGFLLVRAPGGREVSGKLFFGKPNTNGMVICAFKIPAGAATSAATNEFYNAEENYYQQLLNQGVPGAAWFRHQAQEAARARGITNASSPNNIARFRGGRVTQSDDLYELFSGGRAVSENLQLDRVLRAAKPGEATVDITNLAGITTDKITWKTPEKDAQPEIDPLAACIPADQHAVFFRSFQAMTQMMDEADANGTPILELFELRAEDHDSKNRYQKQLCLGLGEIARRFGPTLVQSVAFTGSDPYLRTGTDVGVLFEAKSPEAVKTFIASKQAAAALANPAVKVAQSEIEGVACASAISADRSVCSYLAVRDSVVFVSNSRQQMANLLSAAGGKRPAMASQGEYLWFRRRCARSATNETAFVVLTDAAIRRWCGPQWRIGAARRTRAAAALTELQAAHLVEFVAGSVKPGPVTSDFPISETGELTLTPRGVASSIYGSLDFLTPISELDLAKVSAAEADEYKRWRDTYQLNWSQYFDPIAARFSFTPTNVSFELSVMPLILRTRYHEFIDVATGAAIAPDAGDRHAGALAHLAMSINSDSETLKRGGNFLSSVAPGLNANPLGWLGQTVAIYADEDPFWDRMSQAGDVNQFMEKEYTRLPIALYCEVKNPLGLVAFLTSVRAYSDQSAPGMAKWSNEEYQGRKYVKITATSPGSNGAPNPANLVIYYAVTPQSLVITLNETVLHHALDRSAARTNQLDAARLAGTAPWVGTNLCLQLDHRFFDAIGKLWRENEGNTAQRLAWSNLPILNEWKRLFPTRDPVKLHEQFWQTKLTPPGGGTYVWNEQWQTMESTVYGHPGEPKNGPAAFGPWLDILNVNLGVSFENLGLSGKAVVNRRIKTP